MIDLPADEVIYNEIENAVERIIDDAYGVACENIARYYGCDQDLIEQAYRRADGDDV